MDDAQLIESVSPPEKGALDSLKSLDDLERLTEQYETMGRILHGLQGAENDTHTLHRIELELLETRHALLKLSSLREQTAKITQKNRILYDFITTNHLSEKIDALVLEAAAQSATQNVLSPPGRVEPQEPESPLEPLQSATSAETTKDDRSTKENIAPLIEAPKAPPALPKLVTEEEFSRLSSYIRGRNTVEKVNETYEMLRDLTNKKYELINRKNKKTFTNEQRDALVRMKSETVPELKGYRFITEQDLVLFQGRKLPKVIMNHLVILRSLGRIREVRQKNLLRIVLTDSVAMS